MYKEGRGNALKKSIIISILVIGLGIFLVPIVGYSLSTTAHQSTNMEEHTGTILRLFNVEKGNSERTLTGAKFQVAMEDENGTLFIVEAAEHGVLVNGEIFTGKLKDLATDKNGQLQIEGLTPGMYLLFETKAPIDSESGKTYELMPLPIEVEIDHHTKEIEVFAENAKNNWSIHLQSGLLLVGVVLMLGAFIALRRIKN